LSFERQCPTCGAVVGKGPICQHCGTLVALELQFAKIRTEARNRFSQRLARLPKRIELHHLVWLCALMPIFVLPPVFSFFYAVIMMRRDRNSADAPAWDWLAILSAVNVVISLALWVKFHFAGTEMLAALLQYLKSLTEMPLWWRMPERPLGKIIPI
jgi:hypothetical protein